MPQTPPTGCGGRGLRCGRSDAAARRRSGGGADPEAGERDRLDPGLVQHGADGLLGLLGEGLVDQHLLLEEAVDPTLDDLRQGALGLALLDRRLAGETLLGLD